MHKQPGTPAGPGESLIKGFSGGIEAPLASRLLHRLHATSFLLTLRLELGRAELADWKIA